MRVGRVLGLSLAGVMILVGGVWFCQGNGWLGGSAMTGVSFWAYAGAVTAGLGIAFAIVVLQRSRDGAGGSDLDKRYGGRR